jgi:tRNA (guanine-N7-)-methyltransferase
MAQQMPDWNFLGLEIREPLVAQANQRCQDLELNNLHFLFCNANTSLGAILDSLPQGVLQRVSIQFPDPWFKKRHQKRRVVQPELVDLLAQYLVPGGWVFLQSDVESVAAEMCDRFLERAAFRPWGDSPWIDANPLPVMTERELSTLEKQGPVYRVLLVRRQAE